SPYIGERKRTLNLPNDIGFELLVRYAAELTSPEENLEVESYLATCPQARRQLQRVHDAIADMAFAHAIPPQKNLKPNILRIIGNWENKRTLWLTYCLN
ncbi:MAG: hypothetical protein AAGD05_14005, partial [Bacteroidota bacterium]